MYSDALMVDSGLLEVSFTSFSATISAFYDFFFSGLFAFDLIFYCSYTYSLSMSGLPKGSSAADLRPLNLMFMRTRAS